MAETGTKWKVTNKKLDKANQKLIKKLKKLNLDKEDTLIVGIARGGLVSAQYVAYGLGIQNIATIQSILYNDEDTQREVHEISNLYMINFEDYTNFILVDDLYDSGTTINNIRDIIRDTAGVFDNHNLQIIAAVAFTKHSKSFMKENSVIYGSQVPLKKGKSPWLVFPWDGDQE